jgi:hypothetical protein
MSNLIREIGNPKTRVLVETSDDRKTENRSEVTLRRGKKGND